MNVGIIGNGFVGNAVYHTFSTSNTVRIYDINPERSTHSLSATVGESDIIFVCVPTPMQKDGHIDLSYINGAFDAMGDAMTDMYMDEDEMKQKIFIIKSTVVPGTTEKIEKDFGLTVLFSPEFLTEKNAVSDALCSTHTIIGGRSLTALTAAMQLFRNRFGNAHKIMITESRTAEFIKYMRNCYFATKVTFMNEMFRIACNAFVNWEDAVSGFSLDGRIAHSHLQVPGSDGMYGFGGTCFPKDLNAMISYSTDLGFIPPLLTTVDAANLKYRGNKDWEQKIGRAVS
jgi:nucleotide sugar dehydrogenase